MTVLLSGCGSPLVALANTAAAIKGDYTAVRGIAYGDLPQQQLDIYKPATAASGNPVLVFFYGGSWQDGRKEHYAFAAQPFADAGYTVVIPDYRKYPPHRYPAFMEDAAAAVAWVHGHIGKHGGNPDRLFLAGHSAGGHMAAMLASNPVFLERHGLERSVITAMAGLSGAYDFVPTDPAIVDIFSPVSPVSTAMPTHYIDGNQPPMLLLWGADDDLVGQQNIDRLAAAIEENGGTVETRIYDGIDHIGTVSALSVLRPGAPYVARDVLSFFKQQHF